MMIAGSSAAVSSAVKSALARTSSAWKAMPLVEEDESEVVAALAVADIDADVVARRDLPAEPPDHLLVARCARQHRLLPPGMIAEAPAGRNSMSGCRMLRDAVLRTAPQHEVPYVLSSP